MKFTYKKLNYEYTVIDTYTCGIILEGWEIPAIKENGIGLNESYAVVSGNNIVIRNSYIKPSKNKLRDNSNLMDLVTRDRQLLLNKKEIIAIKKELEQKGLTAIIASIYRVGSLFKAELAICKGKKNYDKRQDIKKKDLEREQKRMQD